MSTSSVRVSSDPAQPGTTAFVIAFSAIYLIWGSTYLGMRVAVESMPPFLMGALRFLTAGAALLLWLRLTHGPLQVTRRQLLDNALTGGFLLLGGNGLVAYAEQSVPSGITALIIGASPLVMVSMEWLWPGGKRPGALTWLGLVVGLAGITWLAAPWRSDGLAVDPTGLMAIAAACLLWSFGSIFGKNCKNPAPAFVASALQMLFGGAFLALTAGLRGEWSHWDIAAMSSRSWWALTYLTAIGSLVGFSTFAWLMKHSTPAKVSTYAYVNPVVAVFLGWLILDEEVGHRTLTASALILASVALVNIQKLRAVTLRRSA